MPRILILKPSSLGDIIHALLIAQAMRQQLPGCRIVWVAREVFAPLVRAATAVDEVLIFERQGGVRAFCRLLRDIRRERFDFVLDLQGLARTGLMALVANAPTCYGRADARELLGRLVTRTVPLPKAGSQAHAVEILAQFLPEIGLRIDLGAPLEFEAPAAAPHTFTPAPIVVFPDSRRPEKEWPHFVELTRHLLTSHAGQPIVWAGSQIAGNLPPELLEQPSFINRIGQTALEALPSLVAQARLVIANDSGPMHLAAALHRPLVALFGPTPPERFGPWPLDCPRHRVLRAPGGDLNKLTMEAVAQTVDTVLAGAHSQ
ncbi:MAG: glycosyltransferase family 9 protein [Opitutales bacterium]